MNTSETNNTSKGYFVPWQDIVYSRVNVFTSNKIYEIKEEKEDGFMAINDKGMLDFIHHSSVRSAYDTYARAWLHTHSVGVIGAALLILLFMTILNIL